MNQDKENIDMMTFWNVKRDLKIKICKKYVLDKF